MTPEHCAAQFDTPGADPPGGAPWDTPIDQAPLVFLDVEMTGLDPERDQIIEVCFLRQIGGKIVDELSTILTADMGSHPDAFALHGIEPGEIANAPRFETIAPRVVALLKDAVPVAHGTALDAQFLGRALYGAGAGSAMFTHIIDTVTLARRAVAAARYNLPAVTRALALPERRWHRAREDALAVRALFNALTGVLAATTPRDLWEVRAGQREPVRLRRAIAAQLESLAASGAPCVLVTRARGHPPSAHRVVVERWAPPRAYVRRVGSKAEITIVRADRILRIER